MRPTFKDFKQKALQDPDVRKEYENLKPIFEIKKQLIEARLKRGLTQEELAKRLGTKKSNISRIESLNNTVLPNLKTLIKYSEALNSELKISFN
jgi:DNA-binding XRE family transcriptional regulator